MSINLRFTLQENYQSRLLIHCIFNLNNEKTLIVKMVGDVLLNIKIQYVNYYVPFCETRANILNGNTRLINQARSCNPKCEPVKQMQK